MRRIRREMSVEVSDSSRMSARELDRHYGGFLEDWARMGGEFEFCPMACDKNVDVGIVSEKKLEFCPVACDN